MKTPIHHILRSPRALLSIGLLLGVSLVVSTAPSPNMPPNKAYRPNISHFDIPQHLDFCGEKIPLDIPEVYQRMDREFLLNLQWDGQVMLYLKRSGQYFPLYEKIFREEGVPEDLKYLSVAESALYMSQSSKNAVGLWQFIPETARRYGLRVDDFVDERRNVEKSTRAAVQLLKDNYKRYGAWTLSATAYNMGEGATDDDLDFQKGETYYDLYVNEETSRYVFRIVAIKEIMSDPVQYGFHLEDEDYYDPVPYTEVTVHDEIPNLSEWAREYGTTYKHVKLLNPWIKKRVLPKPESGSPYKIALPVPEAGK